MSGFLLNDAEWSAVVLSLRVAIVAVAAMAIPGVLLAWLLAKKQFPGRALIDAAVHLPLVLPPVVVGYVLLVMLGRNSAIGGWLNDTLGIDFAFTWQGAALAAGVMGFPLLVRSARLAIDLNDARLEDAGRTLGASPLRILCTITIPLALPGIVTGLVLAFARCLGEFGATIMFAGNIEGETRTLPLAVYSYMQQPDGDGPAMRLVVISILISFAALIVSELLMRRMRRGHET